MFYSTDEYSVIIECSILSMRIVSVLNFDSLIVFCYLFNTEDLLDLICFASAVRDIATLSSWCGKCFPPFVSLIGMIFIALIQNFYQL